MRKLYNSKGLKKYVLSIRKDFIRYPEKYPKLEDTPTPPAVRKCSCCASTPTTEAKGFHCPHCPLATPPPSVGLREAVAEALWNYDHPQKPGNIETKFSEYSKSLDFIQDYYNKADLALRLLREQGVPKKDMTTTEYIEGKIKEKLHKIVTARLLLNKDKKKYGICDFFGNFEMEDLIADCFHDLVAETRKEVLWEVGEIADKLIDTHIIKHKETGLQYHEGAYDALADLQEKMKGAL